MVGLASCAGIGFTVALFVTSLSFSDPALADSAKVGILAASLIAGGLGYGILRTTTPPASTTAVTSERAETDKGAVPAFAEA